jgi:hypothetical protein
MIRDWSASQTLTIFLLDHSIPSFSSSLEIEGIDKALFVWDLFAYCAATYETKNLMIGGDTVFKGPRSLQIVAESF